MLVSEMKTESAAYSSLPPQSGLQTGRMLCIILSYNGCDDTLACIKSICDQPHKNLDLVVIDNASSPGVVDTLRSTYPDVELIALTQNSGWAGGNNVGMRLGIERGYEWVCLLNNDTVFPDGEVANWVMAVSDLPPCLLHPTIYYWDHPEIAQLNPNETSQDLLESWHGRVPMNYAYGACLAIHREIIETVGLFDERLFLQLEESDFHYRAVQHHYQAVCDTRVKIFHKESLAFGGKRAPIKNYYSVRNSLLLIKKRQESIKQKLTAFKYLYWNLRTIAQADQLEKNNREINFLMWMMSSSPRALAARLGIEDYLKGRFGKISDDAHSKIKISESHFVPFAAMEKS
jgi:GT2 family glycosyltransferase